MYRNTFFIILILISINSIEAQEQAYIDSLKQAVKTMPKNQKMVSALQILNEKLLFIDLELAKKYGDQGYELAKELKYDHGILTGIIQKGDYFYMLDQLDSASTYYLEASKFAKSTDNIKGLIFTNHYLADIEKIKGNYSDALIFVGENIKLYEDHKNLKRYDQKEFNLIGSEYMLMGEIYMLKGEYNLGLKETLKSLKFFENQNHKKRISYALSQLADIESALGNDTRSIKYNMEALTYFQEIDDKFTQANINNQIGASYIKLNELQKAKTYYNKSFKLASDSKSRFDKAVAIRGLGEISLTENNLTEANLHLNEALKLFDTIEYRLDKANTLQNLAKLEIKNNNYKEALSHINQSIGIAEPSNDNTNLKDYFLTRSIIYEASGQPELALMDYKKHKTLNDSIFSRTKSQQIEELRTIYETEKKEQEILRQKNEIDLLNIKGKVNNLQRLLLGLGFLLALIAFYAFFQKNKRNKLAKENAEIELGYKSKELTTHALHLAKKNEVLNDLKQKAILLKADANADPGYQMLIQTINFDLQDDNNWRNFSRYFEEVHKDFNTKAQRQFPNITPNDLRLMALLKMNLSSKEIANILNISSDGIKKARQRLRKKMGLDADASLEAIVINI